MDDPLTVEERVQFYLEELDVPYYVDEDPQSFVVRLSDEVAIRIGTFLLSSGHSVVWFVAPVMLEVQSDDGRIAPLAEWSGDRAVGKIAYVADQEVVTAEHELLGDFLDREELANVLTGLAEAVGDWRTRLIAGAMGVVPGREFPEDP